MYVHKGDREDGSNLHKSSPDYSRHAYNEVEKISYKKEAFEYIESTLKKN